MDEKANKYGVTTISTTISRTLWEKAKEKDIRWSEAMRIGIISILNDKGDEDYINPMQQQKKIEALVERLQQFAQDKERLEQQIQEMRYRNV